MSSFIDARVALHVTPAEAGAQSFVRALRWVPAFAATTTEERS